MAIDQYPSGLIGVVQVISFYVSMAMGMHTPHTAVLFVCVPSSTQLVKMGNDSPQVQPAFYIKPQRCVLQCEPILYIFYLLNLFYSQEYYKQNYR